MSIQLSRTIHRYHFYLTNYYLLLIPDLANLYNFILFTYKIETHFFYPLSNNKNLVLSSYKLSFVIAILIPDVTIKNSNYRILSTLCLLKNWSKLKPTKFLLRRTTIPSTNLKETGWVTQTNYIEHIHYIRTDRPSTIRFIAFPGKFQRHDSTFGSRIISSRGKQCLGRRHRSTDNKAILCHSLCE